ncbi:hypothetical protein [Marinobacterium stanieri]|uniref:hypothetical protein n=1 Tax=Marinobacterium stanieri TaxID=49186 RepID=UPI000255925F|nr:hypothetical protein [Marinobacterium stanieri]
MSEEKKDKAKGKRAPNYPRSSLEKALRIPKAILEQNAGRECTDEESATYVGVKYNKGPYNVEVNTAIKYGLLERPESGKLKLSEIARKILKPQESDDYITGMRGAAMKAPVISDIYAHYRGENLPDSEFFDNALTEKFKIPEDKLSDFKSIFFETLESAKLISEHEGKYRILDEVEDDAEGQEKVKETFKKLEKSAKVKSDDSCFVMMPFRDPYGSYYDKIYKPAIEKAGLKSIRADDDIFGTGKIIDQIWSGINDAKVLIAELTTRNPNVFYELGLAHALEKPVVLVSSNEDDVPFDLNHIRVIYYDVTDPFWGQKLIEKVSENILSAIKNPDEAVFKAKGK